MKYSTLILSFLFFLFTNINAQETDSLIVENPIELTIEARHLGNKKQNVFMVQVRDSKMEEVEKAWSNALEKRNKAKMEFSGNERIIKGITLDDIDKKTPLNVYSEITEGRNGIKVYAAFQINDSTWIDPESESSMTIRAERVMINFGKKIYIEVLNDKLVVENKKLIELEKSYDENLEAQSELKKSIQSDSLVIYNSRNEIELKKKEYSTITEKLSQQRNDMASTKYSSNEAKKEDEKSVKEIEKEQKKVTKAIEKTQNEIIDKEKNIASSFYKIEQLKVEERGELDKVTKQKSRIDQLTHEIYTLEN